MTVDHNIIIYGLPKLETKKQVGHLNDVVCIMGMLIYLRLCDLVCVLLEYFINFYGTSCNFLSAQNMCLL